MTVTETGTTEQALDAVRAGVEVRPTDRIASHLHPEGSFDLADHVVPTGREEVWRFTPLRRLRGLHDGTFAPGPSATVEVDAPDPVTVELVGRDDPRLGSVLTPRDRVSAQAWASFPGPTWTFWSHLRARSGPDRDGSDFDDETRASRP